MSENFIQLKNKNLDEIELEQLNKLSSYKIK